MRCIFCQAQGPRRKAQGDQLIRQMAKWSNRSKRKRRRSRRSRQFSSQLIAHRNKTHE